MYVEIVVKYIEPIVYLQGELKKLTSLEDF